MHQAATRTLNIQQAIKLTLFVVALLAKCVIKLGDVGHQCRLLFIPLTNVFCHRSNQFTIRLCCLDAAFNQLLLATGKLG